MLFADQDEKWPFFVHELRESPLMPIREAKAWRVYRYQKPDSEQDGKLILALLVWKATPSKGS